MHIKIHSSELNRMMKTVVQCISPKDMKLGNIKVIYDNNLLTICGTNGSFSAVMSAPLLGGDGESFCVDGTMFSRVCAMCGSEIEISTDDKACIVKGNGRTRMPIVKVEIPEYKQIKGTQIVIPAEEFTEAYNAVAYAISADQTRPVLTGVLMDCNGSELNMVALDGFQVSKASMHTSLDSFKAVVPGAFMKLLSQSISSGETIKLTFSKTKMQVETDGMLLSCGLLAEEYPDYNRIMPADFKTECMIKTDCLKNALKSGSVVNTQNNLVRMDIGANKLYLMSNSEEADFQADIDCEVQGDGLAIAFNQKYLMNTINAINAEYAVIKLNTPVSPCIVCGQGESNQHLVLPVRVRG